jgi:hypothetical protein
MSRLAGLSFALVLCVVAPGATLQQLSMDQMSQNATSIIRARVVSSSASFNGSTIYTHYQLQVSETWKGTAPADEVMLPGGTANGYKQSFPGIPQLTPGAEYVLFLWRSPSTGITHLIGLSQGVFDVSKDSDGTVVASRARIGEMMLDAAGRKVDDKAVRMTLNDMKAQVSRAGSARTAQSTGDSQ